MPDKYGPFGGDENLEEVSPLSTVATSDLVAELRKRTDLCCGFDIGPGEPFEITIDAEEIECPFCEGPALILVVID